MVTDANSSIIPILIAIKWLAFYIVIEFVPSIILGKNLLSNILRN